MSRYLLFLSSLSLFFPTVGFCQGGVKTTLCFEQATFRCAEMGAGYQGACGDTACLVLPGGFKLCPKDKGLDVFDEQYIYLDVIQATGSGSTQVLPNATPVACGVVVECECYLGSTNCEVIPATGVWFEPEEFIVGPVDCSGGGSGGGGGPGN